MSTNLSSIDGRGSGSSNRLDYGDRLMAWLTRQELLELGFPSLGENVLISNKASLYNCANICIGNNVRIDDFCVLSAGEGGIHIGKYIHIAAYCSIIGNGAVKLDDFSGLSSRVSVYSSSDDYSGKSMTNPMIPSEFTNESRLTVHLGRHVIVGSGSVILPGAVLEEGVAVGALTLVSKRCKAFGIYSGNPARWIKSRSRTLLDLEQALIRDRLRGHGSEAHH